MNGFSEAILMVFLRLLVFGVSALGYAQALIAQSAYPVGAPNRYQSGLTAAPGTITSIVTKGDSVLERRTIDPNEEVQVIVQFQSPPLSALHRMQKMQPSNGAAFSTAQSQIENDHTRFKADMSRLDGATSGTSSTNNILKVAGSRLGAEYRKIFNGVALRSRRWLVDRLRSLQYVRSISPDKKVQALDATSNHQIGADSVWVQYGLTGEGVRVGVIDSGIDYMHPDLGGGFGPGHKVAGGWDFVNNDADPADDNGHGTHVAGIVAADGVTLKGVAPKAALYAYKVLDAQGAGEESNIIAALERAVDPDGDPSTDDHLDIVNLSLGFYGGDPTDAVSQAVDNTSAYGVLCVASAGNGYSYQSIGSPGCAAGALTVGASEGLNVVAAFSSCGPTNGTFALKPDLLAPGVDITSTWLGGSFGTHSGTSMAAPHVAGAAALLKQLHPDWSPEMLKGILMGSAKDLGQEIWRQGKGRLDVLKAVRARTLVHPQTLSFGLDDLGLTRWSVSDTITIYNLTDSTRIFTVSNATSPPVGIAMRPATTELSVPAYESRELPMTFEVDNRSVSIPPTKFQDITGVLELSDSRDTVNIPWAVILASYIDLEITALDGGSPGVWFTRLSDGQVIKGGLLTSTLTDSTWRMRQLLPPGSYEMIARIDSWWSKGEAWLTRDSLSVNPTAVLAMSTDEALYKVGVAFKDENGVALDSSLDLKYCTRLYSKRTGVGVQLVASGPAVQPGAVPNKVCPLSSNYVFDYYYKTDPELPKVYSYGGQASPVLADQVADIRPGDLVRRDIEYRLHGGEASLKALEAVEFLFPTFTVYSGSLITPPLTAPFHQEWYAQGQPVANFPWDGVFLNHQAWFEGSTGGDSLANPFFGRTHLVTPNQAPGTDGVLRSSLLLTNTPVQESRNKKVIYGLGPSHYFGRMDNQTMVLRVKSNTAVGISLPVSDSTNETFLPLFVNQAMDYEPRRQSLTLRDSSGRVIGQGMSPDWLHSDYPANRWNLPDRSLLLQLPKAGRYTLQVWDPSSYVLSLKGAAIVNLTVDTHLSDPNPPAMASFNILGADSEYTDMLLPGEQGRVEFRVSDAETGLHSVSLFYHTDSARVWVSLPLTNLEGDLYRGQLPAFALRDGLVSLRVLATDVSGNAMDYRAEPALHIGPDYTYANRPPVKPSLLTPAPGGILQLYDTGLPTLFSWQSALDYDGWDTLSYSFHIRGSGLGTAGDRWLRDTTVTLWLMGYLAPDELYRWWVETSDGHVVVASDTAIFRTSSTILSAPGAERELPRQFSLAQNYPNPFNPTTTIGYELPKESRVVLKVYNLLGQEVMTLVDREEPAGRYRITVDGRGLASGVYIYRLQAVSSAGSAGKGEGSFTAARKFLLVR